MIDPNPLPEEIMLRSLSGRAGRGTYEAHVTVAAGGPATTDRFRAVCGELDVKPVLIELPEGETPSQLMTASYIRGDLGQVAGKVAGIARRLRAAGFAVTRVKIEAVATNEGVPVTDDDARTFPPGCYFEFHVKLALPADADLVALGRVCDQFGAKLSRNAFKQAPDGRTERFVTLRLYRVGRRSAFARHEELTTALAAAGFTILNQQREYSVFDSHVGLDAGWLAPPPGAP